MVKWFTSKSHKGTDGIPHILTPPPAAALFEYLPSCITTAKKKKEEKSATLKLWSNLLHGKNTGRLRKKGSSRSADSATKFPPSHVLLTAG